MELALSLGGDTQKPFPFLEKSTSNSSSHEMLRKDVGFCMDLGKSQEDENDGRIRRRNKSSHERKETSDPQMLQFSPLPLKQIPLQISFPWLSQNTAEPDLTNGQARKVLDINLRPIVAEEAEEGENLSSPNSNSEVSSFQIYRNGRSLIGKRDQYEGGDTERVASSSKGVSDEDESSLARKKLRLTKEQSAFLEESFKEHNTLNPKQKLALAKELNLRPRKVEVWFQNRRARTKLKQTEVDCEYLKRRCETLTEENSRLQKELQELRALRSSQHFYMQLPATTLTLCPSCEFVATTAPTDTNTMLSNPNSKLFPFPPAQVHAPQAAS